MLADDVRVSVLSVRDSGANITARIADLVSSDVVGKLGTVTQSDCTDLTLTKTQFDAANASGGVLSKLRDASNASSYGLRITQALASDVATLVQNTKVRQVSVSDSSANIASNLTTLGAQAAKIGTITQTGTAADIGLTLTQLNNSGISAALGKIAGSYTLNVSEVTAARANSIANNANVARCSMVDTAAKISANFDLLANINNSKLGSVTVSDPGTAIDVTAGRLLRSPHQTPYANLLNNFDGSFTLNALNASVADALTLSSDNRGGTMTVRDAGASVSARFAALNALIDSNKLTAITLTDPSNALVLPDAQYADDSASMLGSSGILNGGSYRLPISGVSAAHAADDTKNVNADTRVVSYSVKDAAASVVANLATLHDHGGKLQGIQVTDNDSNKLELTGQAYLDYIGTLSKINGGTYDAKVSGLAASAAGSADGDSNVSEFTVDDTAANLVSHLAALETAAAGGKLTDITQSGSGALALSYAQWNASSTALGLMAANSLTWTVSNVAAGEVATVVQDTQVSTLTVSDTADNIAASLGDASQVGDLDTHLSQITGIAVSDAGTLALSGTQYADNRTGVLALISNGYQATVSDLAAGDVATATADANVLSFTVKDTGANLETNFADLVAAGSKLTGVTQDDTDAIKISLSALVGNPGGYANTLNKFDAPPLIELT